MCVCVLLTPFVVALLLLLLKKPNKLDPAFCKEHHQHQHVDDDNNEDENGDGDGDGDGNEDELMPSFVAHFWLPAV